MEGCPCTVWVVKYDMTYHILVRLLDCERRTRKKKGQRAVSLNKSLSPLSYSSFAVQEYSERCHQTTTDSYPRLLLLPHKPSYIHTPHSLLLLTLVFAHLF